MVDTIQSEITSLIENLTKALEVHKCWNDQFPGAISALYEEYVDNDARLEHDDVDGIPTIVLFHQDYAFDVDELGRLRAEFQPFAATDSIWDGTKWNSYDEEEDEA